MCLRTAEPRTSATDPKAVPGFFLTFFRTQCEGRVVLERLRVVKPRTGGPSFGALLGGVGIGRRPFSYPHPPEQVTKTFLDVVTCTFNL